MSQVWAMFNGKRGDQLPILNQSGGPFPPQPASRGWVAMGWPEIGSMKIWEKDFANYERKFKVAYPDDSTQQRSVPWNFAYELQIGDYLVCPSYAHSLVAVGLVTGDYSTKFGEIIGLRPDFIHFREVRWEAFVKRSNPNFGKLPGCGLLTLSRLQNQISTADLKSLLELQ